VTPDAQSSLIGVSPGEAIDRNSGERFRWDEAGGIWRSIDAPPRKPETGERIDGTAKAREPGACYLCRRAPASVYCSYAIPQCGGCYDRFRRKE